MLEMTQVKLKDTQSTHKHTLTLSDITGVPILLMLLVTVYVVTRYQDYIEKGILAFH